MTFRPEAGLLLADKYRLLERIGRGGMGQVWTAVHAQLDRVVAIKFIDPGLVLQDNVRARFEREALTAARLQSQHIVRIYDHGIDGDTPYIVMELLEGEDLAERLNRQGRMPLATAVPLLVQAAKGVQYAHDKGVIHRDLKPRNLFMARDGDDEVVKILDFGVAKVDWSKAGDTKTGDLVGSPHYMSPEQVLGARKVDHRTDLWSLAVIFFRMITGKRPFQGEGVGEVIVAICTDQPLVASELEPRLPRAIDEFFARGLARDPSKRFQTARQLWEALLHTAGTSAGASALHIPLVPGVPSAAPPATGVRGLEDEERTVRTPVSGDHSWDDESAGPHAPHRQLPLPAAGLPAASAPPRSEAPARPDAPAPPAATTPLGSALTPAPPFAPAAAPAPAPALAAALAPIPSVAPVLPPAPATPAASAHDSLSGPAFGTLGSLLHSLPPQRPNNRRVLLVVIGASLVAVLGIVLVASLGGGEPAAGDAASSQAAGTTGVSTPRDSTATDTSPAPDTDATVSTAGASSRAASASAAAAGQSIGTKDKTEPTSRGKGAQTGGTATARPRATAAAHSGSASRDRLGY